MYLSANIGTDAGETAAALSKTGTSLGPAPRRERGESAFLWPSFLKSTLYVHDSMLTMSCTIDFFTEQKLV